VHEHHAANGFEQPEGDQRSKRSGIAYRSKEFGVTGDKLHEILHSHGTGLDKRRAALKSCSRSGLRTASSMHAVTRTIPSDTTSDKPANCLLELALSVCMIMNVYLGVEK
jgi:hypothetical protein